MATAPVEWRVYCSTEQQVVKVWDTEKPTTCPNNPLHDIRGVALGRDGRINGFSNVQVDPSGNIYTAKKIHALDGYFINNDNIFQGTKSSATSIVDINVPSYITAIPGMSITIPANGDYLVRFNSYGQRIGTSNIFAYYAIFHNNVIVDGSERVFRVASGDRNVVYTQSQINANKNDVVDIRAKVSSSASNFRIMDRIMTINRV